MSRRALRTALFALVAASVIGVAIYLTIIVPAAQRSSNEPPPTTGTTDAPPSVDTRAEALAKVPAKFKRPIDAMTGAIELAAERLPDSSARAAAAAIARAVETNDLIARDPLDDAHAAPRTASELASALTGQGPRKAGTLELATLFAALRRARGTDTVQYGILRGGPGSATEILARRYVVGDGDAWLTPTGTRAELADIVVLDEPAYWANVLAWRALGALAKGETAQAKAAIGHARQLSPADPAILTVEGKVQLASGLAEQGIATLERAAEQQADALTYYTLGRISALDGRGFRADQYFQKAADADPKFAEPHIMLADLTIQRLELTPLSERPALIERAKTHLAAARARDPKAQGLRITEGHIAALEERWDDAEKLLHEEKELYPRSVDSWLVLAQFLAVNERDAEAIEVLAASVQLVDAPELHEAYGTLLAANGRFEEALPVLEQALAKGSDSPDLRPQLAQLYRANERVADSRKMLLDHLEAHPDDHTARLLLGQLELEAAEFDTALAAIKQVLDADPEHADAALLDYVARLLAKKPSAVARKRVISIVGSRSAVAQVLMEQGLSEESESLLDEALIVEPDDAVARVLLVALYTATARPQRADELRKASLEAAEPEDRDRLSQLFDEAVAQATATREEIEAQP